MTKRVKWQHQQHSLCKSNISGHLDSWDQLGVKRHLCVIDLSAKARYGMGSQTGFTSETRIGYPFNEEESHFIPPLIPYKRGRVSPGFPTFFSSLLFWDSPSFAVSLVLLWAALQMCLPRCACILFTAKSCSLQLHPGQSCRFWWQDWLSTGWAGVMRSCVRGCCVCASSALTAEVLTGQTHPGKTARACLE